MLVLLQEVFSRLRAENIIETFAPVAHMTTVRTLIAMAATSSWTLSNGC